MSLLADLLSKLKTDASRDEKTPSTHDIPPTLSNSLGNTSKVSWFNNRYLLTTLLSVAFIAFGVLLVAYFGLFETTVKRKSSVPTPVVNKEHPKFVAFSSGPQIGLTPLVATPKSETHSAKITLGESATSAVKPKVVHRARKVLPQHRMPVKVAALPRKTAVRPAPRRESLPEPAHTPPQSMDTGARDTLLYAARSAEQANDWKSALACYRKAQEIDPGNYKIMSNLAAVYNNLGLFDEGIQEAERALARKPNYVPALINAAIGYSTRGNNQRALRLFETARALDPGNRNLTINLGILYERAGNLDEAQAIYRPLASIGDPLALEGMGRIYERKGNRSEAARSYRQILRTANASPALKREVKGRLGRLEE